MNKQFNQIDFITANQFNINNLTFKEWSAENFFDKNFPYSQLVTFPNYKYDAGNPKTLIFKINWTTFKLSAIPPLGTKYYEEDAKRNSIRYTFDPEQSECSNLEDTLRQIDEYLTSDAGKNKLLGTNKKMRTIKMRTIKKRLKHQPIVVDPLNDNDDPEKDDDADPNIENDNNDDEPKTNDIPFIKYPYCKLRFALDENQRYKTSFFLKKLNSPPKAQPEPISIYTASELENYFSRGSEARFLVKMTKIWLIKELRDNKYQYGAAFTILQMEIKEKLKNDFKNDFLSYSLGDEGEYDLTAANSNKNINNTNMNISNKSIDHVVVDDDKNGNDDDPINDNGNQNNNGNEDESDNEKDENDDDDNNDDNNDDNDNNDNDDNDNNDDDNNDNDDPNNDDNEE